MKKIFNNILNFTNKFSLIFTIICLSIATLGAIFTCLNRSHDYLNPVILILITIVAILAISKTYKFIQKLNEKQKKIISIILIIVQFILLFFSTQIISSKPQVDLIQILSEINSLNSKGVIFDTEYFSIYPNNKFLVVILYAINKISPANHELLFELSSCLCITIMSLFTYKTTKKALDSSKALMTLIFCVSSPIFYLYVSYYYTDIFMLPFASILIYLIVSNKNKENFKHKLLNCIYIGIIAGIGYKIRAVCIFILIAYFVYLVFEKKFKNLIKTFIPITISLVLSLAFATSLENKLFTVVDNNKKLPATHWIMMGVHAEKKGYYSHDDYLLSTTNAKTTEETKKLNIEIIKQRLKHQGFLGNITLLKDKLITVWGKGDYSYQKYLTHVKDYNISYRYLIQDENIILNYILQAAQIVVLLLSISSLITLFKAKKNDVMAITLFGAVFFYLFWEVCPRYGLSFLPCMFLLSSISLDKLNTNFEKYKYFKYLKETLVILTTIILLIGFVKYTNIQERSTIVSKNNIETKSAIKKLKFIKLNPETYLTQEIKLNNKFNEIKLKFKFSEEDKNKDINLELLNENNEIIYKQNILISNLINQNYTSFKLDKTYPKGKYIIKLSTDKKSNLEVYTDFKQNYDFYNDGKLKINDIENPGDLMFEINHIEKRRLYTIPEYIIFIIITLGCEYIILFKKEGKNNEK